MKMRKFAALMLTLCMMLSLSISAFAASDTIASGTIQDSKTSGIHRKETGAFGG